MKLASFDPPMAWGPRSLDPDNDTTPTHVGTLLVDDERIIFDCPCGALERWPAEAVEIAATAIRSHVCAPDIYRQDHYGAISRISWDEALGYLSDSPVGDAQLRDATEDRPIATFAARYWPVGR